MTGSCVVGRSLARQGDDPNPYGLAPGTDYLVATAELLQLQPPHDADEIDVDEDEQ